MKIPRLPPGEIARRAVQSTESAEAARTAKVAAFAAQKASGIKKKQKPAPEHGQQIFVFNHLQKKHVVYSLTQAMNNNAALAQLPFNGKKSVPAALRKDLWHPFAHIKFPSGAGKIGLSVFQKLREYRTRHEHEWGNEIILDADGKPRTLKERAKAICDQQANSVADMAAVLNRLEAKDVTTVKSLTEGNPGHGPAVAAKEEAERKELSEEQNHVVEQKNIGLIGEGSGTQVQVLWSNLHDAEMAEKWSGNIEHDLMSAPAVPVREVRQSKKKKSQVKKLTPAQILEKLRKKQAGIAYYERKVAAHAERKKNDPEWYERVKAEGLKRKAEKGLL